MGLDAVERRLPHIVLEPVVKIGVLPSSAQSLVDPGPGWQLRYWAIFVGQAFSLIGSALTQFVLMWWITDTTGSVSALATAGLVALLPQALLGPLGGTFADAYSRRFLMIVADAVSAVPGAGGNRQHHDAGAGGLPSSCGRP